MERTWTLTYGDRPWLLNAERAGGARGIGGHFGRAELVATWRTAYAQLCLAEPVPPLQWIEVEAIQHCRDRRMPDIGACFPAVKAAIDGIVDAGVIPDDNPEYLRGLTFRPPVCEGRDALVLKVSGILCGPDQRAARERALRQRLAKRFR